MSSMSAAIFTMNALASVKEMVLASTLGIRAFNWSTSLRNVGVDENVGKPAIVAVPCAN